MISCIVLTLNEEKDIARCLRSLAWCDDIHIVDSGSTDDTLAHAESSGVRFSWHLRRPMGVYRAADQRNWALTELTLRHEWVLFVDADEALPSAFVSALQSKLESSVDVDAILCAPKFMYHGKWLRRTKKFPTWEPRVFRKGHARLTSGTWERLEPATRRAHLEEPYLHFANSKGLDDWVRKHLLYSQWEADQALGLSVKSSRGNARRLAEKFGFARPFLVYFWFLFVRGAIYEGTAGWSYARRMFIYELLIRERISEALSIQKGLPL